MVEQENHNFEKNCNQLSRYNPKLVRILKNITEITHDIKLAFNHFNEPILVYNGIPLHADKGAEIEARNIFKKIDNSSSSTHVVFGLGIGYLFQEFALKSKGMVILYEPDIQLLRMAFELVDFSIELSRSNVRVVSDFNDLKHMILLHYKYKAGMTLSSLPAYRKVYEKDFNAMVNELQSVCGTKITELNTTKALVADAALQLCDNLPYLLDEVPLVELKDSFKGKTALIVSAGPTLDNNIQAIKENRENVVIFVVGTALKVLIKNGIKPDFLNIMESNNCFYQIEGVDISDLYLILEPCSYKKFHQAKPKKKFAYLGNTNPVNRSWAEFAGIKELSDYESRGTVSYQALVSAKILGFKRIVLVGQDLAYVDNKCYSQDSVYSNLKCEVNEQTNKVEVKPDDFEKFKDSVISVADNNEETRRGYARYRVDQLNNTLLYVKGIQGNMLPTEAGYSTFINYFAEFAKNNRSLDLVNTSMYGAQIDGFKNQTLTDALSGAEVIGEFPDLNKIFAYDKDFISKNINDEYDFMKRTYDEIVKVEEFFYKYDRAYNRTKSINKETNKHFGSLLNYYSQLRAEGVTSSKLFTAISFSEDLEIQHLLTKFETVDENAIQEVYKAMHNYYIVIKSRVRDILDRLRQVKELLRKE